MRFVRGDSLKEAIARFYKKSTERRPDPNSVAERALEFRKLLSRFIDVCNAIEYAHSRGVLHRDLKPGNIMLGNYGETLVVDWGLAKPVGKTGTDRPTGETTLRPSSDTGSAPTQMGVAVGTPAFMSPEQASGRIDELGPASDVYSLGATLFCLLTGQAPVTGTDQGTILRHVQRGEIPRPRQVSADVPLPLEAVCLKALATAPEDRYTSPRELADEIERWLADEPVQAWREPARVRLARWVRRHRSAVVAAATLAAILTTSLTANAVFRWHRLDLMQRQIDDHIARGEAATAGDDFDVAIGEFAKDEGLSRQEKKLDSVHRRVTRDLEQLEKHRRFRVLAEGTLREGVHALRDTRDESDTILEQAEEALGIYGVLDDSEWQKSLSNDLLSDKQIADVHSQMADVLNLVGIRIALFDTRDDAAVVATRRSLQLYDRAEQQAVASIVS